MKVNSGIVAVLATLACRASAQFGPTQYSLVKLVVDLPPCVYPYLKNALKAAKCDTDKIDDDFLSCMCANIAAITESFPQKVLTDGNCMTSKYISCITYLG